MGTAEFEAFVTRATFLDRPDPIAAWRELSARQAALVERLGAAEELRIEAEGTDLTLRVGGRTWVNSDGSRNMPSGEVFTGPLEDSRERPHPLHDPVEPARRRGLRDRARVPRRRRRRRPRRARPRLPAGDARHRPGRPPAGRDRHRHEHGHRPAGRRDPLRREDRRHRPPRGRPLLSGDRRHQRERRALGHDLRPARRRPAHAPTARSSRRDGRSRSAVLTADARPRYGLRRSCAVRRSSPPSVPPPATRRSSSGWSRPGWTSRA